MFKATDRPITTVMGAAGFAIWDCSEWTEYTDSKSCFLYIILNFSDKSTLKIHRNGKAVARYKGKIISELNLYTHDVPGNNKKLEEKENDTRI
jgi:hypothetical protein